MKMKKILVLLLALMLVLTACGTKQTDSQDAAKGNEDKPLDLTLDFLFMAGWGDKDATIVKDQLEKLGIKVNLVQTPDYATYSEKLGNGDYDMAFSGWTTVTGNPDYAVRSLFTPGGDYNNSGLADPKVEELILKAATQTPSEYVKTYGEFEQYMMDNAYIVPVYSANKIQAYNKEILKPGRENVRLSKSRSMVWEKFDFNDTSKRKTAPVLLSQTSGNLTSLDPIKGNDGSINTLNTNMYVRLVNLTDDDVVTSDGSLSYEHAIAEGNKAYYFVLRDDISFAKVQNGDVVDSGELVGAEDVVFHLNRAKDKDSVPEHRTYTLHGNMKEISIVTDLAELENTKTASGKTLKELFDGEVPSGSISELVASKNDVDNSKGKYQVVRVETVEPFPQVLNFLAHQSAGITSEAQVTKINGNGGTYGDQNEAIKDDHLRTSGPYCLYYKDDQIMKFKKNPAYMVGTEHEPKVDEIHVKIIPDTSAAVQALFSGEIHVLYGVPSLHYDKIKNESKLDITEIESNAASYIIFNLDEKYQRPVLDMNLRKTILNAIDPKAYITIVQSGRAVEITSTVTPLIKNLEGYEKVEKPTSDDKAKEYLKAYSQSK